MRFQYLVAGKLGSYSACKNALTTYVLVYLSITSGNTSGSASELKFLRSMNALRLFNHSRSVAAFVRCNVIGSILNERRGLNNKYL